MLKTCSIAEAKSHLSKVVRQAEDGPPVELTRRGRPVAVVLSIRDYERLNTTRMDSWDAVEKLRRTHDLAALEIDPDEVFAVEKDLRAGAPPAQRRPRQTPESPPR